MAKVAKTPSPLKLRLVAAAVLGAASFAIVANPGSRVAAVVALGDAVAAGSCLWAAHLLGQVKRAERRRKERI